MVVILYWFCTSEGDREDQDKEGDKILGREGGRERKREVGEGGGREKERERESQISLPKQVTC